MSTATQETQTWYRARSIGSFKIEPFEVTRVTPKQIVYLEPHWIEGKAPVERRSARQSSWEDWFPTQEEAVEHVRGQLTAKVASTQVAAKRAADALAAFNAAHGGI